MGNVLSKGWKIARHEHTPYVLKSAVSELLHHPIKTGTEGIKSLWHATHAPTLPEGVRFEPHMHSHYSDGSELSDMVDALFDKKINIASLTDHDTTQGFDDIASGAYTLPVDRIDVHENNRSMNLYRGNETLTLLRSVEASTDKGHFGIHGFSGEWPAEEQPYISAIHRAKRDGAFSVANHPFFWEGAGYHNEEFLTAAVYHGVFALEKNGTEIGPQLHSPLHTERLGKLLGAPVVAAGDAHNPDMLGRSGVVFDPTLYDGALSMNNDNTVVSSIAFLIDVGQYSNYQHYLGPRQFLKFFDFDA